MERAQVSKATIGGEATLRKQNCPTFNTLTIILLVLLIIESIVLTTFLTKFNFLVRI